MKKVEMYLSYLNKAEKYKMVSVLGFLCDSHAEGKEKLISIAQDLYPQDVKLDFLTDNGNKPSETSCYTNGFLFYTLMQFEQKDLTEQMIGKMGKGNDDDGFPWRYLYTISLCNQDKELYLVSFSNKYSPNWNDEYNVHHYMKLQDVDFPILKEDGKVFRMTDSLHNAINAKLYEGKQTFVETGNSVSLVLKDQHGNYITIEGNSLDAVFKDYADNYVGYRNFRRQMVSEWEIVNDKAKTMFATWKETAKGLKSDFDKFYGGGIVD